MKLIKVVLSVLVMTLFGLTAVLAFPAKAMTETCPSQCICEGTIVDCSRQAWNKLPAGLNGRDKATEIHLSNNKLADIPIIPGCQKVTHLFLENNEIERISPEALQAYPKLRKLFLANNKVTNVPFRSFRSVEKLKILDLSDNKITSISSFAFGGLKNLRMLKLNGNSISNLGEGAFYGLDNIDTLQLNHNDISSLNSNKLFGLSSLKQLDLSYNKLETIRPNTFSTLASLERLSLEHNQVSHIGNGALDGLLNLRTFGLHSSNMACDCKLIWLRNWLYTEGFHNSVNAVCASPQALQGRNIFDIAANKFECFDQRPEITTDLQTTELPEVTKQPQKVKADKGEQSDNTASPELESLRQQQTKIIIMVIIACILLCTVFWNMMYNWKCFTRTIHKLKSVSKRKRPGSLGSPMKSNIKYYPAPVSDPSDTPEDLVNVQSSLQDIETGQNLKHSSDIETENENTSLIKNTETGEDLLHSMDIATDENENTPLINNIETGQNLMHSNDIEMGQNMSSPTPRSNKVRRAPRTVALVKGIRRSSTNKDAPAGRKGLRTRDIQAGQNQARRKVPRNKNIQARRKVSWNMDIQAGLNINKQRRFGWSGYNNQGNSVSASFSQAGKVSRTMGIQTGFSKAGGKMSRTMDIQAGRKMSRTMDIQAGRKATRTMDVQAGGKMPRTMEIQAGRKASRTMDVQAGLNVNQGQFGRSGYNQGNSACLNSQQLKAIRYLQDTNLVNVVIIPSNKLSK